MPKYKVTAEIAVYVDADDEYEARDAGFDLMEWGNADITVEEDEEYDDGLHYHKPADEWELSLMDKLNDS